MKTVRRLFYRDIVSSVLFVALAFLSLFFFIDFVEELGDVGKGYTLLHAAAYSALQVPGHLYELAPIAVLIGTIYALARLAQSSEYTILRTGGLGPGRALSLLAGLGLMFALATFVIGDYLAPLSERQATELQARAKGKLQARPHRRLAEGSREHARRRAQLLGQRRLGRRRADAAGHPHLRVRRRRPAGAAHRRRPARASARTTPGSSTDVDA